MKRNMIIVFLVTCCLAITLFAVIPINSQSVGEYDPWLDVNDDGSIEMKDVASVARAYGTNGTPINKTDLLLELQFRIALLEARVDTLEAGATGYFSIPASAFVSMYSARSTRIGTDIRNLEAVSAGVFYAPVQLPHRAYIDNVTSYWYDGNESLDIDCKLYRTVGDGYVQVLADVSSSGNSEFNSTVDTSISFGPPIIDNSRFEYALYLVIPANSPYTSLRFRFATIGFTYPT